MRAPRRILAASTLTLEAFVLFFAGLVAKDLSGVSPATALAVCGGLALACLVAAGLLRRPVGYALGWLVQVGAIATGLLVPVMYFLGAVFALLWAACLYQGARIERERAEFERAEAGRAADAAGGQSP
jgi:hypothetical protein